MTASMQDRDGRILPATHWASLVIFVILVPALVILWGMPGRTADAWAWTIKPDLTPIFLGAGYGAGAYFFLRTFLASRWPPSSAGVFGAGFFALLTDDVTLAMPPHTQWFAGRDAVTTFLRATPLAEGTRWRAVPTAANGQPSLAFYVWDDGAFTAHGINVLSLRGERIAEILTFLDHTLFARFGLPDRL